MSRWLKEMATREQVFNVVREQLTRVRSGYASSGARIRMETSLVTDLGFDSLSLVEVAAAIEDALQIEELPLLAWSDRESEKDDERFTVASLVDLCLESSRT